MSEEPAAMRAAIRQGICPLCGNGPWRSVANHTRQAHGVSAADLKDRAGIPRSKSVCSPETAELLGERAKERDSVSNMASNADRPRKAPTISAAGRNVFRAGVVRASAARQRIPVSDHERIRERLAAGERKKDVAAEYGVGVARIRQIEQGISYRMHREP